jgi:hypothetical protein
MRGPGENIVGSDDSSEGRLRLKHFRFYLCKFPCWNMGLMRCFVAIIALVSERRWTPESSVVSDSVSTLNMYLHAFLAGSLCVLLPTWPTVCPAQLMCIPFHWL